MEKLLQIGKEFGLEGEKLLEFVEKQQKLKEERRREEEEKEEKRRKLEEERRREEEEKKEKRRQLEEEKEEKRRNDTERAEVREDRAKAPKLPSFVDGKDDLDAYLQRFERFATTVKWEKTGWASKLSALLSGRALEVYRDYLRKQPMIMTE
ncbi:unnamed protein product [Porites lobata]|uniref:Uncharacterized protein n=1 Tax=Porites lobata TaxID=104759 RepID=A0ABN8QBR7_9CNID|nr:unnamed protein product [Porites lobata]